MNRVNPLHIGGLLVVLIAFLLFQLKGIRQELVEAKSEFFVSETLAVDLNALKSVYANKKKTKNTIERILRQASIKAANLTIKREKKSIKISSKSINTLSLNALMGKVLNSSLNITALKTKRLSETKASLSMEIKW